MCLSCFLRAGGLWIFAQAICDILCALCIVTKNTWQRWSGWHVVDNKVLKQQWVKVNHEPRKLGLRFNKSDYWRHTLNLILLFQDTQATVMAKTAKPKKKGICNTMSLLDDPSDLSQRHCTPELRAGQNRHPSIRTNRLRQPSLPSQTHMSISSQAPTMPASRRRKPNRSSAGRKFGSKKASSGPT
jgi:hypothetical protein